MSYSVREDEPITFVDMMNLRCSIEYVHGDSFISDIS